MREKRRRRRRVQATETMVASDGSAALSSSSSSTSSSRSRSPVPKFSNSFTTRIFSDVAGDVTIVVDGDSFLLHKFPLVARCGKIRKIVAEAKDSDNFSRIELPNFPGGPDSFEHAMKFCYGINFEITASNVAGLRSAAEYLYMAEVYREDNLITRTEVYLNDVVFKSIEKSVEVLCTCETLPDFAEEVGIPNRCVEAIAVNTSKEQLVSGFSRLDCDNQSAELKTGCLEWWIEDLSVLRIDYYRRVISAMRRTGIRSDAIIASLMHYAEESLKNLQKYQQKIEPGSVKNDQKTVTEVLVSLMPAERGSPIPLSFLFGMLKVAIVVDAATSCKLELERRIAQQLEMATLDDLLMIQSGRIHPESLYDVDTVHRIVLSFLQRIEDEDRHDSGGYESESGDYRTHGSLLKVGGIIDAYLAEIAPDPYLSLQKFIALLELLPDYARILDDGLYRAIDIYLKAHPALNEQECKKLCKFIDCEKLSQEASNHAAQNDRLPVQMVVRILYFEQLRLKNGLSGDSGDTFSSKLNSGLTSGAVSPRDNYASLRRENRELKLEISRVRLRLSELEKEQVVIKQGMLGKSGNGKTLLNSLSKGIGRIGIFGGPAAGRNRQKHGGRKSRGLDAKTGRSKRHYVS